MPGDGVRIKIDGDSRGAERAIKRVGKAYDDLGQRAERASRRAGSRRTAGRGGGSPAMGARNAAEVASRAGGSFGGAAGQIAGGLGMGGMLGGLAGGVAVAGLALNTFREHLERAAQTAREWAETQQKVRDQMEDARRQADQSAMGQLEGVRRLTGLGGDRAVRIAQALSESGERGATAGVTSLLESGTGLNQEIVSAIRQATATGLTDFAQAAKAAEGVRFSGDSTRDAAAILQQLGLRADRGFIQQAQANIRGSAVGFGNIDSAIGGVTAAAQERLRTGNATTGIISDQNRQAAAIRDPASEVRRQLIREMEDQIAVLNAMSQAGGPVLELFKKIGYAFGGEGSYAGQAEDVRATYRYAGVTP